MTTKTTGQPGDLVMGGVTEWVLVPREPTEAMRDAVESIVSPYAAGRAWGEMLKAAPTPPAEAQDIHSDWAACTTLEELAQGLTNNAGITGNQAFRQDALDCLVRAQQLVCPAEAQVAGGGLDVVAEAIYNADRDHWMSRDDYADLHEDDKERLRAMSRAALSAHPRPEVCDECGGERFVVGYVDPYDRGDVSSPVHSPCPQCADQTAAQPASAPVGVDGCLSDDIINALDSLSDAADVLRATGDPAMSKRVSGAAKVLRTAVLTQQPAAVDGAGKETLLSAAKRLRLGVEGPRIAEALEAMAVRSHVTVDAAMLERFKAGFEGSFPTYDERLIAALTAALAHPQGAKT